MSDFEEIWNADMRAALSGIVAKNNSGEVDYFYDINKIIEEKRKHIREAFAYADLCAEMRGRKTNFDDLIGGPVNNNILRELRYLGYVIYRGEAWETMRNFNIGKHSAMLMQTKLYERLLQQNLENLAHPIQQEEEYYKRLRPL